MVDDCAISPAHMYIVGDILGEHLLAGVETALQVVRNTKQSDGAGRLSLEVRNTSSHRLGPRRAGGGGQDGVAGVDGADRPEPRADDVQFTVQGVDGK